MLITPEELALHRIEVSETYAPGKLDYHGAEFRQSAPLKVQASAGLAGAEIRIQGSLKTRIEAWCDRCLAPVEIAVDPEFDLFYRPVTDIAREEEIEISRDDLEIGFYSGRGIEFTDVVTEQVILSVPMKVVCKEDCRGLCPVCGVNRNVEACQCAPVTGTSPFASLKER